MLCSLTWSRASESFILYESTNKVFYFKSRDTEACEPAALNVCTHISACLTSMFRQVALCSKRNVTMSLHKVDSHQSSWTQLFVLNPLRKWIFLFSFAFLIRELDVGAMREAAALLVGTHDFSSFRAMNSDMPFKNPVKTLDVATVKPGGSFIQAHYHR